MKRRAFIAALGGAAAWPLAASAQQTDRVRRIGVLMHVTENDLDGQTRLTAFVEKLKELGWSEGRNVRFDIRWGADDPKRYPRQAAELVALAPDVLIGPTSFTLAALQGATRSVPIVFPILGDPVGAGFVDSLARPGGNVTGFMNFEFSMGGKWLELLKEIAPSVTRVAVLRDTVEGSGTSQFAVIQAAAPSLWVDVKPINLRHAGEIESAIEVFARLGNGGLILTASGAASLHRDLIIALAAQHKLPAVYYERAYIAAGGLISYGVDYVRRAARYVDRILRGEKPADMPVQAPTKYELVVNLKTAKAMGLELPATVLARADEVIE